MVTSQSREDITYTQLRKPTDYLTHDRIEHPDQLGLFLLAKEGFAIDDVRSMVSASVLYSSLGIINRIVRTRSPKVHRQGDASTPARLNAQQSAVAYQFARALEHAITVFGTMKLAEEWLARPCRYLAGNAPVDMIDIHFGFRAVEDYLERVELGVYQ
jgi:putative toxin-antitoxin system antitoxin component (TIGR02293 family)